MHSFYGHWVVGKGNVVEAGLDVVSVSEGTYEVKKAVYAPPTSKMVIVQVSLDSPWKDEMTLALAMLCSVHGAPCSMDSDDCSAEEAPLVVARWAPVVTEVNEEEVAFKVKTYERTMCWTVEEARSAPAPVLVDVGFVVHVFTREVEEKEKEKEFS